MPARSDIDVTPAEPPNPRASRMIALDQVDNAVLIEGIALWRSLCAGHSYPSRTAITARLLKPLLRNTTLLRVVDGGRDYEYRVVGDAFVMAHGRSFQGLCWSQIQRLSPGFYAYIKPIYDQVVQTGMPLATRGWIERGAESKGHVYCEYVYLPLGGEETGVDHILIFAVYLRQDGIEHVSPAIIGSFAD